ncbi:MAG TPA: DUF664 domain-containing protein [Propionibacteriaceae bacterium]|nr:DUF664 domain-containing protein [Propionibacteriaceae bacterium]
MSVHGAVGLGEKEALHASLYRYRTTILESLHGLTGDQLRRVLTPSGNSLIGLVKHLAEAEGLWLCEPFGGDVEQPTTRSALPESDLRVSPHESVDEVMTDYRRVRLCSDRIIDATDLDADAVTRVGQAVTLRSAMANLIEDVIRHTGHVDVMRALVDERASVESTIHGPTVGYSPVHRVLFVCSSNAGKSQMAEALMNLKAGTRCWVSSAGTQPARRVSPLAAGVVREIGGDMSRAHTKLLDEETLLSADVIVILGSDADVVQPPGMKGVVHRWIIDEPAARGIMGADRMRLVRDDIEGHINALVDGLGLAE